MSAEATNVAAGAAAGAPTPSPAPAAPVSAPNSYWRTAPIALAHSALSTAVFNATTAADAIDALIRDGPVYGSGEVRRAPHLHLAYPLRQLQDLATKSRGLVAQAEAFGKEFDTLLARIPTGLLSSTYKTHYNQYSVAHGENRRSLLKSARDLVVAASPRALLVIDGPRKLIAEIHYKDDLVASEGEDSLTISETRRIIGAVAVDHPAPFKPRAHQRFVVAALDAVAVPRTSLYMVLPDGTTSRLVTAEGRMAIRSDDFDYVVAFNPTAAGDVIVLSGEDMTSQTRFNVHRPVLDVYQSGPKCLLVLEKGEGEGSPNTLVSYHLQEGRAIRGFCAMTTDLDVIGVAQGQALVMNAGQLTAVMPSSFGVLYTLVPSDFGKGNDVVDRRVWRAVNVQIGSQRCLGFRKLRGTTTPSGRYIPPPAFVLRGKPVSHLELDVSSTTCAIHSGCVMMDAGVAREFNITYYKGNNGGDSLHFGDHASIYDGWELGRFTGGALGN